MDDMSNEHGEWKPSNVEKKTVFEYGIIILMLLKFQTNLIMHTSHVHCLDLPEPGSRAVPANLNPPLEPKLIDTLGSSFKKKHSCLIIHNFR